MYDIVIKQITEFDIPDKVKWYNDDEITEFLHYEEKFTIEKSLEWIKKIENDTSRYENVLKVKEDSQLVNIGIIGLFNIDLKNKKAGFYITIGSKEYQGKGLAKKATIIFLKHCFNKFNLEKIYLYTDCNNITAQKLYEKVGFTKEGLLRRELFYKNRFIDRYYYGILRHEFFSLYLNEGD
jgi:RimJ/RimL family protein N-acetyltransferase